MSSKIIVNSVDMKIEKIPLPYITVLHNTVVEIDTSTKNNEAIQYIINSREKIIRSKGNVKAGTDKFKGDELKNMLKTVGIKGITLKVKMIDALVDYIDGKTKDENKPAEDTNTYTINKSNNLVEF